MKVRSQGLSAKISKGLTRDEQDQTFCAAGICPREQVVCVVVDECHRATGKQDIVQAIRQMSEDGCKFRVVGLSATPGGKKEAIQVMPQHFASRLPWVLNERFQFL